MKQLDMEGCKCLGAAPQWSEKQHIVSICWDCRKPLATCAWLMLQRPYLGSEYYTMEMDFGATGYVIVRCPKWEGEHDEI